MNVSDIIKSMQAPQTKTAAAAPQDAQPAGQVSQPQSVATDVLSNLEKVATAAVPSAAPVSSEADAVEILMQQATKLAAADEATSRAEAAKMGAAFADGFIAKMAAYEQAVSAVPSAPAASIVSVPAPVSMETKLAQDLGRLNPATVQQQAAQVGYQNTLQKEAEQYKSGHDTALQEVADLGVNEFYKGAAETEEILRRYDAHAAQQA